MAVLYRCRWKLRPEAVTEEPTDRDRDQSGRSEPEGVWTPDEGYDEAGSDSPGCGTNKPAGPGLLDGFRHTKRLSTPPETGMSVVGSPAHIGTCALAVVSRCVRLHPLCRVRRQIRCHARRPLLFDPLPGGR